MEFLLTNGKELREELESIETDVQQIKAMAQNEAPLTPSDLLNWRGKTYQLSRRIESLRFFPSTKIIREDKESS